MKTSSLLRISAAAVLGFTLLAHSGCLIVAAGAAGAGTVAYVRGDLEATIDAGYDRALRASKGGLEHMKYIIVSERSDAVAGELIARTALDKKVQVRVTRQSDSITVVRIRVGVFGDEELSRSLLDAIKARL